MLSIHAFHHWIDLHQTLIRCRTVPPSVDPGLRLEFLYLWIKPVAIEEREIFSPQPIIRVYNDEDARI